MTTQPFIHLAGVAKTYGKGAQGAPRRSPTPPSTSCPASSPALVGPSGCGKSTLLKILAGLHPHDAGTVKIGSATSPVRSRPGHRHGVPAAAPAQVANDPRQRPPAGRDPRPADEGEPRARPRPARPRRPHGRRGQAPLRALGRHAAARRDRARARPRPQARPHGRALRRPRRADAREDEPRAAAHLEGSRARRSSSSPTASPKPSSSAPASSSSPPARPAWPTISRSTCRIRARST